VDRVSGIAPTRSAPDVEPHDMAIARAMRFKARRGWYTGDEASLQAFGARQITPAATEPELTMSLTLSRDRMHHSVGWWRNAEYEYCWHLSVAAKAVPFPPSQTMWASVDFDWIPRDEVRYWSHAIFGEHVDKLWFEPGGTDPRLTRQEALTHAKFWHMRLFLDPELLDARGEPHVPFIPAGEVYDLTRWIDGLTPEKVDR
jgi:hypothetical protein